MIAYVVDYDIFAAILLGAMLILYFTERRLLDEQSRCFTLLLGVCFSGCVFDVIGVALGRQPQLISLPLLWFVNLAFLSLTQLLLPLALFYVVNMTGNTVRPLLRRQPWLILPFALSMVIILSSPLTGWACFFNEQHLYDLGPLHKLLYVDSFLYLVYFIYYLLAHRRQLGPRRRRLILGALVLLFLALLFQALNPEYLITYPCLSISLLVAFTALQAPSNYIDRLTGLFNREALVHMMRDHYVHHRPCAVAVWALDDFSKLNAAVGVAVGDRLLWQVGQYLSQAYPDEVVARYAGDRLAVLMSRELPSREDMRDRFRSFPRQWPSPSGPVALSATRVMFLSQDYDRPDELLEVVDFGLSQCKAKGQGHMLIPQPDFRQEYHTHLKREQTVTQGLEQGRVQVWFQPILDLSTGRVAAAEALARMFDQEQRPISPEVFVPLAERAGLIAALGDTVLDKTCRFLQQWDLPGAGVGHISVNLSVLECLRGDVYERVRRAVSRHQVPPSQLSLEITESAAISSLEQMSRTMQPLVSSGFSFHLDDYGSGYSNLAALFNLPFTAIKLDRSLLSGSELVRSMVFGRMVELFHAAGFKVVCEGVETPEQDAFVRQAGIDYGQGFLYSHPLPPEEFVKFVGAARK